jgi:hypothetical protein
VRREKRDREKREGEEREKEKREREKRERGREKREGEERERERGERGRREREGEGTCILITNIHISDIEKFRHFSYVSQNKFLVCTFFLVTT